MLLNINHATVKIRSLSNNFVMRDKQVNETPICAIYTYV